MADGDVRLPTLPDPALVGADADDPPTVICADGGALRAEAIGLTPDLVVGDGDSLPLDALKRLRAAGVTVELHPVAKDESDTELAIRAALARGADSLVILGALGGRRFEHALANVLLLALPELAGRAVIVDADTTIRLLGGTGAAALELRGRRGDFVSLMPIGGDAAGVTTTGLRYALHGDALSFGPSRGLSNEMTGASCSIRLTAGRLVVLHTRAAQVAGGDRR